jgi:hypothetical protein
MRGIRVFLILTLAISFFAYGRSSVPVWQPRTDFVSGQELVILSLDNSNPTQSVFGRIEVDQKKKEFSGYSKRQLNEYLQKRPIPFVIGPDHRIYILDRHHTALALLGINEKFAYGIKKADFSALSWEEFWKVMIREKWVYLYDQNGNPITPDKLPTSLKDLVDDAYRSLVYLLREEGEITKVDIFFFEFLWANFLRSRVELDPSYRNLEFVLKKARKIVKSKEASEMPGYNGPCVGLMAS